jgi:hypothetical protein
MEFFIAQVELGQWAVFNHYGDLVRTFGSRAAAERYIDFVHY